MANNRGEKKEMEGGRVGESKHYRGMAGGSEQGVGAFGREQS